MTEVDSDSVNKQNSFDELSRGVDDFNPKIGLDDFKQLDDVQKSLDQIDFSD